MSFCMFLFIFFKQIKPLVAQTLLHTVYGIIFWSNELFRNLNFIKRYCGLMIHTQLINLGLSQEYTKLLLQGLHYYIVNISIQSNGQQFGLRSKYGKGVYTSWISSCTFTCPWFSFQQETLVDRVAIVDRLIWLTGLLLSTGWYGRQGCHCRLDSQIDRVAIVNRLGLVGLRVRAKITLSTPVNQPSIQCHNSYRRMIILKL